MNAGFSAHFSKDRGEHVGTSDDVSRSSLGIENRAPSSFSIDSARKSLDRYRLGKVWFANPSNFFFESGVRMTIFDGTGCFSSEGVGSWGHEVVSTLPMTEKNISGEKKNV